MLEPVSSAEAVSYYPRNRADEIAHETHGKHGDRHEQFLVWCDETDRTDMTT